MATDVVDPVKRAATRVREEIIKAHKGGYYPNGWYSYIGVLDIEILLDAVLGPHEEPVPPPKVKMQIADRDGNVLWEGEVERDSISLTPTPDAGMMVEMPLDVLGFAHRTPGDGVFDADANTYTTGTGQVISAVHDPAICEGRGCCVHHPSPHHLREMRTHWRSGGVFDIKPAHMERICEHDIGHPDPDDLAVEGLGEHIGVHGCDGCCVPPVLDPPCSGSGYAHAAHGNCPGYTYDRT